VNFKKTVLLLWISLGGFSANSYSQTVTGWDAVLTSGFTNGTTNNNYHLIGTYQGWDPNAIYIAGYHYYNNPNFATKRIYMGSFFEDLGNGRIGIGTSQPRAALELTRSGTDAGDNYPSLHISSAASGNIYGPMLYLNGKSGNGGRMWGICSSGQMDATGGAGNFAIYDLDGGSRLVINSSGNVGIGTTNPHGYKLAIAGSTIAESVTVMLQAQWPDYVFKPNYQLPKLSFLNSFIKQNQHLPEMPSEKEIAKTGINLGEMVKIQTKKIEELTLYMIEKDRQIQIQNSLIMNMQSRLKKLEKRTTVSKHVR
jgi:hypothetical protein